MSCIVQHVSRSFSLLYANRAAECGQSARSLAGDAVLEEAAKLRATDDDFDVVLPHFQRVAISGEDTSGVGYTYSL